MRPQRPRRAGVMWLKNAHSEVGCGIRRVFAIRSRPRRHLCTELCTGSVDNAVPLRRRPPRRSGTESAVTSSQRLWDTFCAPGSPRPCFPTTKLVLMTEGHRHVSESEEEAPGEESLATAKLRADVARQQMRLAKDQLKRARNFAVARDSSPGASSSDSLTCRCPSVMRTSLSSGNQVGAIRAPEKSPTTFVTMSPHIGSGGRGEAPPGTPRYPQNLCITLCTNGDGVVSGSQKHGGFHVPPWSEHFLTTSRPRAVRHCGRLGGCDTNRPA